MMKHGIRFALVLCVAIGLCGCSNSADESGATSVAEETYTQITDGKGFYYYVNDDAVQVAENEQVDAKKITDSVESYTLAMYSSYNGRLGVVDGSFIAASGLEAEMDARIRYNAEKYKEQDFSDMDPYLKFQVFDIKDDTAKVIVSFEIRDTNTGEVGIENHEGYVFIKEETDWKLINNIVDTGNGGDATLDALSKSDDPEEWRTTYNFEQLKRSDYEDAHDFTYYLNDQYEADPQKIAEDQ